MAITRAFAYNPSQNPIPGTESYGTLVVGVDALDFSQNPGGIKWWMGPDETDGYVIGTVVSGGTQPSPVGEIGTVRFWRTEALNSQQFVGLASQISGQSFASAEEAKLWMNNNNFFVSYEDSPIPEPGFYVAGTFFFDASGTNDDYRMLLPLQDDGYLDTSISIGTGFNYSVECVAVDSNNKMICGGFFTQFNGVDSAKLIRLNADGSYDSSFNVGNIGFSGTGSLYVYDVIVTPGDKVIAVGNFTSYKGVSANRIARLNTDGSLDNTFTYGTGFNNNVGSITQLSDGKLIACGDFTSYNGVAADNVAKLNSDGTRDTSFATGIFNGGVSYALEQPDGKIVLVGDFTTYSGQSYPGIVRVNSDGSVDNTFVVGAGFTSGSPIAADIQADGKLVVVGSFTLYQGVSANRIIRLNSNGSIDTTFNYGSGLDGNSYRVKVLSSGKIYVCGFFTAYNGEKAYTFLRLNSNGTIDSTFSLQKSPYQQVQDFAINSNNTVILARPQYYGYILRKVTKFNYSGATLDLVYNSYPSVNNTIEDIVRTSDGKMYLGGNFNTYGGTYFNRRAIARFNYDGSLDETFVVGSGFTTTSSWGTVYSLYVDTDNKVLAGGTFDFYNGNPTSRLCRINSDGSFDPTFSAGTPGTGYFNAISQLSDGSYVAAGNITSYNGVTVGRIVKTSSSGALNTTFNTNLGVGFNSVIYNIYVQPDDKIIVVGAYTAFKGVTTNRIMRLNPDGTRDTSFVIGTGFNQQVWAVGMQSDGKIILGGIYTTYSGITSNKITRLNTNGSFDTTFNVGGVGIGLTANEVIYDLKVLPDDRILIGGGFLTYNNVTVNRVAMLNADGSLDTSLITPGVDNMVYAVDYDPIV